jgi:hypothetical protein
MEEPVEYGTSVGANDHSPEPAETKKKECKICGQTKPLSDFVKSPACKDGVEGKCKECKNKMYHVRYSPTAKAKKKSAPVGAGSEPARTEPAPAEGKKKQCQTRN